MRDADGRRQRGRAPGRAATPACWHGWVLLFVGLGLLGVRADVFVSPDGSDRHSGTRDQPLATLEAAREAVRAWKRGLGDTVPTRGFTVWLLPGDHRRTNALELTSADSGWPEAPVRWRALSGGTVRLRGGVILDGFAPVADAAVRERFDPAARDHVLQVDLGAAPAGELGSMVSRGFGRPTAPAHAELFFGGRPMTLARWPNEGAFETIAGFPSDGARGDDHGGQIGDLTAGFHYAGDRPRRWKDPGDLWVHGYWAWDWANSYERVEVLDVERRHLRTAPPHGLYGFRKGQRFHFLNVLEELDQPGEWYLDRRAGRLYFWPPRPVEGGEALLSLLGEPLVRFRDASHVVVQGLILEGTRATGVEVRGGEGIRIEDCWLHNLGNHGVVLDGGRDHAVTGCDVIDTGDGGVVATGGDRATLSAGGHLVENGHFQRQGRWSKCYVPAIHLQGVGLRARHNLIEDHPHCGILLGGNDHRIEYNEIRRVALETGDVGAIYAGRDYTFRGNRVLHNFIHHTGGVGMGSMGVYMDDCVSGTEIRGNIFYRVQRAAFLGGGRDHEVVNNVFVECNHAVELDGRGLDASPVWRGMVDSTMRGRLGDVPLDLYRRRYPALAGLDASYGPPGGPSISGPAFRGVPPENNRVERNVCVGKWLHVYWHATPAMLVLGPNLVGDAPGFVGTPGDAATARTFALRPDSAAWAMGFRAIPVEEIGLRPSGVRPAAWAEVPR